MPGCVNVVFCMDTEGPCHDPSIPDLLGTWDEVDSAMDKLFSPEFRRGRLDSFGGTPKFGWFFLTWTGFETNPVNRDFGYHRIRDHYLKRWGDVLDRYGDEQAWHYHHPDRSRVGNVWGMDWAILPEYDQILSRQILERNWFPAAFRAGATILDNTSSRWVDKWFPIDYNNRAPIVIPEVDWREGVTDWKLYHPDPEDFRKAGSGRRRMARCLDLVTKYFSLPDEEIEKAFRRALDGHDAILAVFEHDYRDILSRIQDFQERLNTVSDKYPSVPWRYAGPVEAVRRYLRVPEPRPLRLEAGQNGREVRIWSSEPLYQSIPWIAVRTESGDLVHVEEDVERVDATTWRWSVPGDVRISRIGVGGSTDLGTSDVVTLDPATTTEYSFATRPAEQHPTSPNDIWEHSRYFPELCIKRALGTADEMDSVRQAVDLLGDHLVPGDSVLDVGCAAGHAWHGFRKLGVRYNGIDSSSVAISIGRHLLPDDGHNRPALRRSRIEDLPGEERYDAVISLSTLYYFPMFHQPLEIMARAASRYLVVRSSFGEKTEIRYLPDVLLEPGFDTMRAYFNIFGRTEVQSFLEELGFCVSWIPDWRQTERFGGRVEEVGGLPLPAEFLFAERVSKGQTREELLGPELTAIADRWHAERGRLT